MESRDFDVVVIKDQDRLMRNPKDWYLFTDSLLKNGKKLYIHLDGCFYHPDNGLITGIKAILAEEYSRHLSRKINRAHRNRQDRGDCVILTNRTWGYRKNRDGTVEVDEKDREMIELIFKMYANGYGSRLICRELAERGIVNSEGRVLAESQIRAIARNPLYMGTAVMNRSHINFDTKSREKLPESEWKYHKHAVPPIVSGQLWQEANRTMDRNAAMMGQKKTGKKNGKHMLSGKVICGECGQRFWRNQRNLRHRDGKETKAVYWYCSEYYRYGEKKEGKQDEEKRIEAEQNEGKQSEEKQGEEKRNGEGRSGCSSLRPREEELISILQRIGAFVLEKEQKDGLFQTILNRMCFVMEKEGRSRTAEELRWEQERLMNKKEKLLELLIDGILEKEDYRKRRAEVDERLGKLELQLGKAGASEGTENGPAGEMPDFRERMKKIQEIYGKRKDMDLSIPVIASHVKQVRIYASRIEVYADFLEPERPVTVAVSMNSGRRSYEFAREDRGVKEKID